MTTGTKRKWVQALWEHFAPYPMEMSAIEVLNCLGAALGLTDEQWRETAFVLGDLRPPTEDEQTLAMSQWISEVMSAFYNPKKGL